jgi:hypothetical protein
MPNPETVVLSEHSVNQITERFMQTIKDNGLVLLPETAARFSNQFYENRKKVLSKEFVTTVDIIKYDLLDGVKSRNTIKNWCAIGKIKESEYFVSQKGGRNKLGSYKILTSAIRRLNKA